MEISAYYIGLKPDEFWNLTLREFNRLIYAYNKQQKEERQKLALHASWVMSPHLKKPISPSQLLGTDKQVAKKKRDDSKAFFERAKEKGAHPKG